MTRQDTETGDKFARLKKEIGQFGSALVAYSGGVDSTFLLKVSRDVLGDRVLAGIGKSETYTETELKDAVKTATKLGVRYVVVETDELSAPGFRQNTNDRCYLCKSELFSKLSEIAGNEGFSAVLDGTNADDLDDIRPGRKAAKELGVRSPLLEAGLRKDEIRRLSRDLGLETWDKPQMACLGSRFPHGTEITPERLKQVEAAENFIKGLGIKELRVRYHGDIARVEVGADEIPLLLDENVRNSVSSRLNELGFRFVTLDLQGYRTGSMNKTGEERSAVPLRED